jgi:hypothetical protein
LEQPHGEKASYCQDRHDDLFDGAVSAEGWLAAWYRIWQAVQTIRHDRLQNGMEFMIL